MSLSQSAYRSVTPKRSYKRAETIKPEWNSPKSNNQVPWEHLHVKASERRPRQLSKPDCHTDENSKSPTNESSVPYSRAHGNTKPQEPPFMSRLPAWKHPPRMAEHAHAQRPWTVSCAPGKRENTALSNTWNRVWLQDAQAQGRWNKTRKQEYYEKFDSDMMSKKPHDEKFAMQSNRKYWTHLEGQGTEMGGFERGVDKLELVPPRSTGLHLKSGLYRGKFENVRHSQVICVKDDPDEKNLAKTKRKVYTVDVRPSFDNRLHDDVINHQQVEDSKTLEICYDLFRPKNTLSCPMLGVDFCNR